jgi:hypothetical protein
MSEFAPLSIYTANVRAGQQQAPPHHLSDLKKFVSSKVLRRHHHQDSSSQREPLVQDRVASKLKTSRVEKATLGGVPRFFD